MESLQQILKKAKNLQAIYRHGLKEATTLIELMEGEVKQTSPKVIKQRRGSVAVLKRNIRINQSAQL